MDLLLQITCVQQFHFMGYATSGMEIVVKVFCWLMATFRHHCLSWAASLNLHQAFSLPFGDAVKTRHKQKGSNFRQPESSSSKCLSPASIAEAQ